MFDGKLSLFKVDAETGNFLHFRFTRQVCGEDGVLDSLHIAFNEGFDDFTSIDDVCCFFASPFTSQPDVCHKLSQTFGVDEAMLQEDVSDLKTEFETTVSRCKRRPCAFLGDKSAGLVSQKFLVLFGSTWSCKSGFSAMNHLKNSLRCRLKDKRLG